MNARSDRPYAELTVLVLREPRLAERISRLAGAGGGRALPVATHSTETVPNCPAAGLLLARPELFDLALFSSPNAVRALMESAAQRSLPVPARLRCGGPGGGTCEALRKAGFVACVCPAGVSSMAELLGGKLLGELLRARVALVQRVGAPARTRSALRRLGARTTVVACYRRTESNGGHWKCTAPAAVRNANCLIAYDALSLRVLLARACASASRLRSMPLAVPHPQIAEQAKILGFESIIARESPEAMLAELTKKLRHAR